MVGAQGRCLPLEGSGGDLYGFPPNRPGIREAFREFVGVFREAFRERLGELQPLQRHQDTCRPVVPEPARPLLPLRQLDCTRPPDPADFAELVV